MFDLMSIIVPINYCFFSGAGIVTWNRIISHLDHRVSYYCKKILHIINMQMQGMRVEHTDSILPNTMYYVTFQTETEIEWSFRCQEQNMECQKEIQED